MGPGEQLTLILISDNAQALKATAQAFTRQLRTVQGLSNISSTASLERLEILIRPDRQRAAEQGVTVASIGEIATSGDFYAQLSKLNLDNRKVGIRVRIPVPSMIGLVMLMGIVTTNWILLVEYAVVGIRQRGLPMVDALVACVRSGRGCRTRGGVVTRV